MKEILNLIDADQLEINILAINGSSRRKNHSGILLQEAMNGARQGGASQIEVFNFCDKKIEFCNGCDDYCLEHLECCYSDDFQEFRDKWLRADGIVWSAPVYHMGPPAQVRAALDRLGKIQNLRDCHDMNEQGGLYYRRYLKAVGPIIQGGSRFGGQEITIQFINLHTVRLNCIPVAGDMPHSCLGVAGQVHDEEALIEDKEFLTLARKLGRRVVEMSRIIKSGKLLSKQSLPTIYVF